MLTNRHRAVAAGILAAGTSAAFAILATPAVSAAPLARCEAPGERTVVERGTVSDCTAKSAAGGAAAAYGDNGTATAWATPQSLSLAIANNGASATTVAGPLSGPAAIAMGPGASITMRTDTPGLMIALAGPGAKLTLDGQRATCTGGMGFVGVLPTLQGCFSM